MKILALDSSGLAASAALVEDDTLIAEYTIQYKKTHSQTLLPMVAQIRDMVELDLDTVDAIAVAAGPGSFTGLRIGSATAKGLALALDKPIVPVPTVEGLAYQMYGTDALVCPIMDARRSQVYNARFASNGERPARLCPDRAIGLEELAAELKSGGEPQVLVGDGAQLCYNQFIKMGLPVRLTPPNLRYQSAWGVARAALEQAQAGKLITAQELVPEYHRLSQAERERLEREQATK